MAELAKYAYLLESDSSDKKVSKQTLLKSLGLNKEEEFQLLKNANNSNLEISQRQDSLIKLKQQNEISIEESLAKSLENMSKKTLDFLLKKISEDESYKTSGEDIRKILDSFYNIFMIRNSKIDTMPDEYKSAIFVVFNMAKEYDSSEIKYLVKKIKTQLNISVEDIEEIKKDEPQPIDKAYSDLSKMFDDIKNDIKNYKGSVIRTDNVKECKIGFTVSNSDYNPLAHYQISLSDCQRSLNSMDDIALRNFCKSNMYLGNAGSERIIAYLSGLGTPQQLMYGFFYKNNANAQDGYVMTSDGYVNVSGGSVPNNNGDFKVSDVKDTSQKMQISVNGHIIGGISSLIWNESGENKIEFVKDGKQIFDASVFNDTDLTVSTGGNINIKSKNNTFDVSTNGSIHIKSNNKIETSNQENADVVSTQPLLIAKIVKNIIDIVNTGDENGSACNNVSNVFEELSENYKLNSSEKFEVIKLLSKSVGIKNVYLSVGWQNTYMAKELLKNAEELSLSRENIFYLAAVIANSEREKEDLVKMPNSFISKVGLRVSCDLVSSSIKNLVIELLKKNNADSAVIDEVLKYMDSEVGQSVISLLLGLGLPFSAKLPLLKSNKDLINDLSHEFQVQAATQTGKIALDKMVQYFLPVIKEALASMGEQEEMPALENDMLTNSVA
jgi:hypothetical protein